MFEATVREGVLRVRREGTRWLSSGWNGGFREAPVAYNVSVPEGWERTDLGSYVARRRRRAGFEADGPALLTALDLDHARGARAGPVEAVATAGISNPAALPMPALRSAGEAGDDAVATAGRRDSGDGDDPGRGADAGTVNLVVGTERSLDDAALANLLAVVAEAKAATLLATTGVPGTTTDAVVVGSDPTGDPAAFTGSATDVGAAARACVRDAVRASLRSRYPDDGFPDSVSDAKYGVSTTRRADIFRP